MRYSTYKSKLNKLQHEERVLFEEFINSNSKIKIGELVKRVVYEGKKKIIDEYLYCTNVLFDNEKKIITDYFFRGITDDGKLKGNDIASFYYNNGNDFCSEIDGKIIKNYFVKGKKYKEVYSYVKNAPILNKLKKKH